jgi:hypothetical protein
MPSAGSTIVLRKQQLCLVWVLHRRSGRGRAGDGCSTLTSENRSVPDRDDQLRSRPGARVRSQRPHRRASHRAAPKRIDHRDDLRGRDDQRFRGAWVAGVRGHGGDDYREQAWSAASTTRSTLTSSSSSRLRLSSPRRRLHVQLCELHRGLPFANIEKINNADVQDVGKVHQHLQ